MRKISFQKFIVAVLILCCAFAYNYWESQNTNSPSTEQSQTAQSVDSVTSSVQQKVNAILDDSEVQKTLKRIEKDAGYYRKDGAVFMNRERLLPVKSDLEYYSEWTVKTPWIRTRGARRIIEGKWGELYFTDDHYKNFTRIR